MSLNQVLAYITPPSSPLIGTLENGRLHVRERRLHPARFIGTGNTVKNYVGRSGDSYFNIGPGLRQSICNKVDFGGAITWATTGNHWADPWISASRCGSCS